MTSEVYKGYNESIWYESLYPHNRECLAIIVPTTSTSINSFVYKFARSSALKIIVAIFVILMVARIALLRSSYKIWFSEYFITWSIILQQNFIRKPKLMVEKIWIILILLFSIITTVLLSGTIYKTLVVPQFLPNIDTLDELMASNLSILLGTNDEILQEMAIYLK